MAIYKSLKELEGNILKKGDYVDFLKIRYLVVGNALLCYLNDHDNDKIFMVLGIEDKNQFCKEHYEYDPDPRNHHHISYFPLSKENDFPALTRIAEALFKLCMN